MRTIIDVMPTTGYYWCRWEAEEEWYLNHCYEKTDTYYNAAVIASSDSTADNEARFDFDDVLEDETVVVHLQSGNLEDYPELFL